ncbi:hypothetical protein K2173_006383 [Erythroxylum novogranatense]|uniref:F-box domain-containing protein n=1 Tax=Erythroxylum novogranatense TaxID=1862640 RepID=A0AAV8U7A9_9ROSI|nr:hypothetical protein K2173_006383 [Erythroxylum novogranatense]
MDLNQLPAMEDITTEETVKQVVVSQAIKGTMQDRAKGKGGHRDWLSEMPDDVLVKILSHLTLKEAARFTILCKRFRNHWSYFCDLKL